jgi:hypothetical protein
VDAVGALAWRVDVFAVRVAMELAAIPAPTSLLRTHREAHAGIGRFGLGGDGPEGDGQRKRQHSDSADLGHGAFLGIFAYPVRRARPKKPTGPARRR